MLCTLHFYDGPYKGKRVKIRTEHELSHYLPNGYGFLEYSHRGFIYQSIQMYSEEIQEYSMKYVQQEY